MEQIATTSKVHSPCLTNMNSNSRLTKRESTVSTPRPQRRDSKPKAKECTYALFASGLDQVLANAEALSSRLSLREETVEKLEFDIQELATELQIMNEYNAAIAELNDIASNGRTRKKFVEEMRESEEEMAALRNENYELRAFVQEQREGIDRIMTAYRMQVAKLTSCRDMERQTELIMDNELGAEVDPKEERQAEMRQIISKAIELDEESLRRQEDMVARLRQENQAIRKILEQVPFAGMEEEDKSQKEESDSEVNLGPDISEKI